MPTSYTVRMAQASAGGRKAAAIPDIRRARSRVRGSQLVAFKVPGANYPEGRSRNRDLDVTTGRRGIDRRGNAFDNAADSRPARGQEHDDGNPPVREILLVTQIGIGRDENIESSLLGHAKKLAVLEG